MTGKTDNRERLSDLMERRRTELGLRWKQVAEVGGISYEAIRAVRHNDADLRAQTKHGIDVGLRWVPGSVQRILEGGDPEPAASVAVPSLSVVSGDRDGNIYDLAEEKILRELQREGDPLEIMIWSTRSMSLEDRAKLINDIRHERARQDGERDVALLGGERAPVADEGPAARHGRSG